MNEITYDSMNEVVTLEVREVPEHCINCKLVDEDGNNLWCHKTGRDLPGICRKGYKV